MFAPIRLWAEFDIALQCHVIALRYRVQGDWHHAAEMDDVVFVRMVPGQGHGVEVSAVAVGLDVGMGREARFAFMSVFLSVV